MASKIGTSPAYLIWNTYSYCFRMKVPRDLQRVIGKKELRCSLRTGYLGRAKQRAGLIAGCIHKLFNELREGAMKLTPTEIDEIIHEFKESALVNWYWSVMTTGGEERSNVSAFGQLHTAAVESKAELAGDNLKCIAEMVDWVLEGMQYSPTDIDRKSLAYKELCRKALGASIEYFDEKMKALREDYPQLDLDQLFGLGAGGHKKAHAPAVVQVTEAPLLGDVWDEYKATKIKSKRWKPGTIRNHEPKIKALVQVVRGIPVSQVTVEMMRNYRRILEALPPGFFSIAEYEDLSLVSLEQIKGKHTETLDVTTVREYMSFARSLFTFAMDNEYIEKNPVVSALVPPKKKNPRGQQDAFTDEDLQKLFSPEFYRRNDKQPHRFWLPILGLYTGARLEELCKLKTTEVEDVEDIWVLNIKYDEEQEGGGLKNENAARYIPLHPVLTDVLKFPEFVARMRGQGHERIFSELRMQHHKYSHHVSRWFTTYRDKTGVVAPPRRKTFHSFRHTFNDHLYKKAVPETMLEELAGRAGKTLSSSRYAKGHEIKTLYEKAILKLDYGIDLTHLAKSRYVVKR